MTVAIRRRSVSIHTDPVADNGVTAAARQGDSSIIEAADDQSSNRRTAAADPKSISTSRSRGTIELNDWCVGEVRF